MSLISAELSFITGVMLGGEWVDEAEDPISYLIVDLFIVRLLFTFLRSD